MVFSLPLCAQENVLDNVKKLLAEGQSSKALSTLLANEDTYIGRADYNFMLAKAYLKEGLLHYALFALERVVLIDPSATEARLLAAKIYSDVGDIEWSQRELSFLNPDDLATEAAQEFDRIHALISPDNSFIEQLNLGYKLGFEVGSDSNVTTAPSANTIFIPSLSRYSELGGNASDDDVYSRISGAVTSHYKFDDDTSIYGSIDGSSKSHRHRIDLDEEYFNLQMAVSESIGSDTLSLIGLAQRYDVDGDRYRRFWHGQLSWQHQVGNNKWLTSYIQYTDTKYPTEPTFDATRTVVGLRHWLPMNMSDTDIAFEFGGYGGVSDAERGDSEYVGYDVLGAQVGSRVQLSELAIVSAGLAYEQRRHAANDPLYVRSREDSQWTIKLSSSISLTDGTVLISSIDYTKNESNFELYNYNKTTVSMALEWEF